MHTKPTTLGFSKLTKLRDDRLGRVCGHCEIETDTAARSGQTQRVDPDHVAGHIEQWTAGITPIDCCVCLDEIVKRTQSDITVLGRHDSSGHRAAETRRIADRHDRLPNAYLV